MSVDQTAVDAYTRLAQAMQENASPARIAELKTRAEEAEQVALRRAEALARLARQQGYRPKEEP